MYDTPRNDFYKLKYSPLLPNILSILSESDLQIVENTSEGYKMLHCEKLGTRYDEIRCIEWSRDPAQPLTIAAGFENGKVSLISFIDEYDNLVNGKIITGNVLKEFNFKGSLRFKKKCNTLAWNANNPTLLAAGYDLVEKRQSGTQNSIAIWDINKEAKINQPHYENFELYASDIPFKDDFINHVSMLDRGVGKKKKVQVIKEFKQLLNKKDYTTALAWLEDENAKILSGSQKGSLKLFDLQGSSPIEVIAHK